jgi:phenylalanyl-tRNA synthetase beta chain
VFDVKADALAVLVAAGAPPRRCRSCPAARLAASGRSRHDPDRPQNVLGYFGELHPRALEALDAEGPLMAFEVILERIPSRRRSRRAPSRSSSSRVPAGDARLRVRGRRKVKAGDSCAPRRTSTAS